MLSSVAAVSCTIVPGAGDVGDVVIPVLHVPPQRATKSGRRAKKRGGRGRRRGRRGRESEWRGRCSCEKPKVPLWSARR